MAWGFLAPVELPTILCGALLVYGHLEEICRVEKKEALHIGEPPGPFNTIRASGYHHGLFDSPFYQASRNVFFLLLLFSVLLVPSIHPSLVRATRLFLPLMANRGVFLEVVKLRFLILHLSLIERDLLPISRMVASFYNSNLFPDLIRQHYFLAISLILIKSCDTNIHVRYFHLCVM